MSKILIIAPAWLGDAVMAQSLYKLLKQHDPQAQLQVMAAAWLHPILERMPEIDKILINPFAHGVFAPMERWHLGRTLKTEGFTEAYILPNSWKSALIPLAAGIPLRHGWKGESRYGLINRMRKDKAAFPRMVERYAALAFNAKEVPDAAALPDFAYPSLKTQPPQDALLQRLGLKLDRPILIIGCGANYGPSKLWPTTYFAAVCDQWLERGGQILALGSAKDSKTVQSVRAALHRPQTEFFIDAAGKTNLTEALDLTACAKAAVCNDSGLMHTCAAVDLPQVCLFGSTSTAYTPPLSAKAICLESDEPCHPCFKRSCPLTTYACQRGLKPSLVMQALTKLGVW